MDRPISFGSRTVDLANESPFELGRARVNPRAHECWVDGSAIHLQPQTLKVLIALHDKLGEAVTRDELLDRCWNGRIVGDDVLNRCISLLRIVASNGGGFVIETIPRSGYRLIETGTDPVDSQAAGDKFWLFAGVAVIVVAALGAIAALIYARVPGESPRQPTLTIRVTPFVPESGNPQSRQLALDARNSVLQMLTESGLSLQTSNIGPAPDLLVSASVRQESNGALANVRIEEPARHAVIFSRKLWADPAGVRDLPDRVGANLAASLSWTAPLIRLDQQHPADPAFTTQLLDGPSTRPDFDMLRNYEFVRRNAPQVPDSAIAQLALAMDTGLVLANLPRGDRSQAVFIGRVAAQRALVLAPHFGDTAIPWCLLHSPVQIRDCENRLRAGLAADSQAPFVPTFLGDLLNDAGRTHEALDLARVSLAQDQYVPAKISRLVMLLEADGEHAEAAHLYIEGLRLWPDFYPLFWSREWGIVQSGDLGSLERFEQEPTSVRLIGSHPRVAPLAEAVGTHSTAAARAACPINADDVRAVECMIALAELGDVDRAYTFANRLYPARKATTISAEERLWLDNVDGWSAAYLSSPAMAAMRRDPRFLALADSLGLLAYWRGGRLPDFCTERHEAVCGTITKNRP